MTRFRLRLAKLENSPPPEPLNSSREFHISLDSRRRLQVDQTLFSSRGNVILADFQAVRLVTQKLNETRDAAHYPEKAVRAGALNAMGLIDEILHYVVALYAAQVHPGVFAELFTELERKAPPGEARQALARFCRDFPPQVVYQEQFSVEQYLLGTTQGVANREAVLEEMLLLWLANVNPAFSVFCELFDDSRLVSETAYPQMISWSGDFFKRLPPFGPDQQNLVDMLRSPALAFPDSLSGQLQYIREKWGLFLGKYFDRLLSGLDLIKEDEKKYFSGPAPAEVFNPGATAGMSMPGEEGERFSPDRDWMPRLVLMAKTVYVWLDQLSKKYQRSITTLDQIPDEELEQLAHWGFTGLWLIGVWERSPASRRIKQKCGNPEALASAYSLYRYEIAADLGGDSALENLKARAWARGIRLASDMVPNHMGIDSPWLLEHLEWFIGLDHSPFPSYSFNGEDLSSDPRVGIYLEDHYYDRTDAAVVFKRVDRRNGSVRYIYHGNDGTRMPWNDTAQLNYLRPDVREAVVQTIMDVARKFPIIRFDAAMTLARKHYQRLWFPPPGAGGDIPSRAGQGMSQENFNRVMPWEFWREVVDRMARETPDTLLLAEAFWMMESYFVRTLGMHRVYNSAFMNFLKMEENAKFRLSLKNALEFNPEILKRYVNFMNNPDEDTALAQFGDGDKYFVACTLMAALPGLPMFGHGQIEGFKEKYGMEYRRAYLDERSNEDLVRRHEQQIFLLLRRRALFAGVEDFLLYDFYRANGALDENVIAFSNCHESERCLVLVHNRFADTSGWIRVSAAFAGEDPFGGPRKRMQSDLGSGLGLRNELGWFVVFRDMVSGLEYIRSNSQLHAAGMFIELRAYQVHVFLDFREARDYGGGHLARLAAYLNGRGVESVEKAGQEMALQPLYNAWRELCRPELLQRQLNLFHGRLGSLEENGLWQELEEKIGMWMLEISGREGSGATGSKDAEMALEDLIALRALLRPAKKSGPEFLAKSYLQEYFSTKPQNEKLLILWFYLRRATGGKDETQWSKSSLFAEWQLDAVLSASVRDMGCAENEIHPSCLLLRIFCEFAEAMGECALQWKQSGKSGAVAMVGLLATMLNNEQVQDLLHVNRFKEDLFFSKEGFAIFSEWLTVMSVWELQRLDEEAVPGQLPPGAEIIEFMNYLPFLAAQAEYRLEKFQKKLADFSK